MAPRYLSVPAVASKFEVTSQTVRNWIASGRLQALQPTRRGRFRIPADALHAFEVAAGAGQHAPTHSAPSRLDADGRAATRRTMDGPTKIDAELGRVVDAIVASVHPQAVFLFGSRARGDDKPDSDFDLAIVAPDGSVRRRVAMQAYESIAAIRDRSVGVDLVVLTPRLISAERDLVGSIVHAIAREGVPVFGHARLT